MSASQGNLSQNWKHPDELLKLHRLKQKKKQLAARFNNSVKEDKKETDKAKLLEAVVAQKRKNPFAKSIDNAKKAKVEPDALNVQDDSLLDLINTPTPAAPTFVRETPTRPPPAKLVLQPFDAQSFSKLLQQNSAAAEDDDVALEEQKFSKHLPMDWSVKTRVRIFCRSELPATTLKTSQMASGLTSCVRCIDTQNTSSGLDISTATRFNQATYYWQHPHLPWLTMFPRNSKENSGIQVGERERKALVEDWDYSFRGLFQLLRARQCPYFYLCCNNFTVLFRAAGTGGCVETHALMSPTTHGMRSALRQEGIEFSMPLKKEAAGLNRSGDSGVNTDESNSTGPAEASVSPHVAEDDEEQIKALDADAEDDEEGEDWLQSLGVDANEIRRINTAHTRQQKAKEMADDFSDNSLVLIEGVECQGFFSFLLNAKSTIPTVGRLAGVPPTLLAPVAFPKATLQHLATRSSKVRMDGIDYCSIEVKGVIMPTFLPYICELLGETKDTFSATLASSNNTLAFSKATQKLLEDPKLSDEGDDETAGQVFGQENLSDCGLTAGVIETMCRTGAHAIGLLERVCFDKEYGFAWS